MIRFEDAPGEVQENVAEFWPETEWDHAVSVAQLESNWNPFAELNTTDASHPCGSYLRTENGVRIAAEHSIGLFQINACNLPPDWMWYHLFNSRHNCGTAHALWDNAGGWYPWYFSATQLGLITPLELPRIEYMRHLRRVTRSVADRAVKWGYNPKSGLVTPKGEPPGAPQNPPAETETEAS